MSHPPPADVALWIAALRQGLDAKQIAKRYGVDPKVVHRALMGRGAYAL